MGRKARAKPGLSQFDEVSDLTRAVVKDFSLQY